MLVNGDADEAELPLSVNDLTNLMTKAGAWKSTDPIGLDVGVLWSMGNRWAHDQKDQTESIPPAYAAAIRHAGEQLIAWYEVLDGAEEVDARTDHVNGPWTTCYVDEKLVLCSASGTRVQVRPFGETGKSRSIDLGAQVSSVAVDQEGQRLWVLTGRGLVTIDVGGDGTVRRRDRPDAILELLAVHRTPDLARLIVRTKEGVAVGMVRQGEDWVVVHATAVPHVANGAGWLDSDSWLMLTTDGRLEPSPPAASNVLNAPPVARLTSIDAVSRRRGGVIAAGAQTDSPLGTRFELRVLPDGEVSRDGLRRIALSSEISRVAIARGGPVDTLAVTAQTGDTLSTFVLDVSGHQR